MKTLFSKILVPVDGSKNADLALDKAITIAEKFESKLILIHVINDFVTDFSTTPEGFQIPNSTIIKIRKSIREQAESMMEKRLADVQKRELDCKSTIEIGDVGSEILQFAQKNDIELIVMGARGLGKFKQLLLGSVSNKVMTGASCPVLIVK